MQFCTNDKRFLTLKCMQNIVDVFMKNSYDITYYNYFVYYILNYLTSMYSHNKISFSKLI